MRVYYLVITFLTLNLMFSCKKKEDETVVTNASTLRVEVQPYFGTEKLYLDSIYQTQEGYQVKFTDLIFYVTDLKNGSNVLMDASLFDYRETGVKLFEKQGDRNLYQSLDGNIGVVNALNHSDPSAFPNNSVLNIMNANTMHWGWNPGYIFFKVEAKVDTLNNGANVFDLQVGFHVGTDPYLKSFTFNNLNWIDKGGNLFVNTWKLDMQKFLNDGTNPLNLKNENFTHSGSGSEALTLKASELFKGALSPM